MYFWPALDSFWPSTERTSGAPPRFLGAATYEDPYLASLGSASKSVVWGDLGAALKIKATPIRVALSPDFLFDKDQLAIRTVQRIALAVQDPAAAAYVVSANT